MGSSARLRAPTNSFVWQNEKIDSRPPNSSPGAHAPAADGVRLVPAATPASRAWQKKSRVSILCALTLDFLCHPKKSRVSALLQRAPRHPPRARRRANRACPWASRGRSFTWSWSRGRCCRRRGDVAKSGPMWPKHHEIPHKPYETNTNLS